MEKVKLSTLPKETIVLVNGNSSINTVEDILEDIEFYKAKEVYTTIPIHASFNAASIIDRAIENEYQNMYEDWDESVAADVAKEDIEEMQAIFDRILARNPEQNIAYREDKLIKFDI
jgi:hypothetical protein